MDGRLLAPAAGVWLGAATTVACLDAMSVVATRDDVARRALAVATVVLLVLVVGGIATRRVRTPVRQALALGAAGLAVGTVAASLPALAWSAAPIGGWVDDRATAVIEARITSEPVVRRGSGTAPWPVPDQVEVRLTTRSVSARGAAVQARLPILVRAPAGIRSPPPGTWVRISGRLRAAEVGDGAAALLLASRTPWQVLGEPGAVDRAAHGMRVGLRSALSGTPPDAGSLVAGLAVGDESGQPEALAEAMRDSGLSHLTAVSGGNVAVVLGSVLLLVSALRLRLAWRALAALIALAFFVVLVGPQPSVLRAAAMGVVAIVATLAGGRRPGPAVLAAAVIVLVIVAPWLAVSWGFGLSVSATAGLVLLLPALLARARRWRATARWPPGLQEAVALTTAAQLATLPLLVAMGGAVGWVALPANLLAMPVVPAVTVLGLLAALIAPVAPAVATVVAHVAAWPAGWIARVAHACADLPLARLPWPEGWGGLLLLVATVGALLVGRRLGVRPSGRTGRAAVVVLGAALVAVLVLPPDRRAWPPPGWVMVMCDVGQGDALVIHAGEGRGILVDAGPDPDRVDACLDALGVEELPLVLLTHFHADHVRGLAGALRGRGVGLVATTPIVDPVEEAEDVDALLAREGMRAVPVTAGHRLAVGPVDIAVLWPRRRIAGGSVPNNASVVAIVTVAGRHLLLSGDIEPEAQAAVAADVRRWSLDVVKIPHHGSRYQSPTLTSWAAAPIALVSVGAGNDYGHPAPETLAAWQRLGALVARTDVDGDVAVVDTDGRLGIVSRRNGGTSAAADS